MKQETKSNIIVFLMMGLYALLQYITGSPQAQIEGESQRNRQKSGLNQRRSDHDHWQSHKKSYRGTGSRSEKSTSSTRRTASRSCYCQKDIRTDDSVATKSSAAPSELSLKRTPGRHTLPSSSLSTRKRDFVPLLRRRQFSKYRNLSLFDKSSRGKYFEAGDAPSRKSRLKYTLRSYSYVPGSSFLAYGFSKLAAIFQKRKEYRRLTIVPPANQLAQKEETSLPSTPRILQASSKSTEGYPRNEPMDSETIFHVTQAFQKNFSHIPHAVYGLSALVQHGYNDLFPRAVHILCPEHTREAICHWASSKTLMRLSPLEGEREYWGEDDNRYYVYDARFDEGDYAENNDLVFAVGIPDGTLRRVRIIFENERAFNMLSTVPAPMPLSVSSDFHSATPVTILSLPAIVTSIVSEYHMSLLEDASVDTQEVMAEGLIWVLCQIIKSASSDMTKLDGLWVNSLSEELFLVPFTESFPESKPLLKKIGIEV